MPLLFPVVFIGFITSPVHKLLTCFIKKAWEVGAHPKNRLGVRKERGSVDVQRCEEEIHRLTTVAMRFRKL